MKKTGQSSTARKWYRAVETFPEHDQQVLIKCGNGYHVAICDAFKEGFLLRGGAFLTQENCDIYWMPIVFP
jgi:hypothetical protein